MHENEKNWCPGEGGGGAGAGEGRKRPNRPTNCHKGTILRTATKALFGALVGGAFLKIGCSVARCCVTVLSHPLGLPDLPSLHR